MTRSSVAVARLLVLPYAVLLALYLAVIGGGGTWLYLQVRAVETRVLIDEIRAAIEPLSDRLAAVDALAVMAGAEPWLVAEVEHLFDTLPALRGVSLRDRRRGVELRAEVGAHAAPREVAPLSADPEPQAARRAPPRRLWGGFPARL